MIVEQSVSPSTDTRSQLWAALAELSALSPDWRLGQLICNVADYAGDGETPHVWDATDEQLLAAAKELIRHRRAAPRVT